MFDACEHRIRQIAIKAAREIRRAKGLPEERNITVLFNEVAGLFGINSNPISSRSADHIPNIAEAVKGDGKPVLPRKDCPVCNKHDSMMLNPLCKSCKDAEGGIYKTMWSCSCGHKEKSDKFLTQWLDELGVDFGTGTKESMGIQTVTDDGLK